MNSANTAQKLQPKYFYPLAVWALLIFTASSIHGTSLPPLDLWSADKFIHSGVFAVLALFSYRAFAHYGDVYKKGAVWIMGMSLLFSLFYGASDEMHQMFVPNRNASAFDFLADAIGIAAAHLYYFFRQN